MEKKYKAIFVNSSEEKISSLLPKQTIIKGIFLLPKTDYFQIKDKIPDGDSLENYLLNELRETKFKRRSSYFKDLGKYFLDISDYKFSKWTMVKGKNNTPIKDNKSWNNHISAAFANLVVDTSELIAKINEDYNSNYYVEATQVLKPFENDLGI